MANTLDDSYLPNLLPYFDPSGILLPDMNLCVECGICGTGLAINQRADQDHEAFAMLPCGHLFGYRCITRWVEQMPNCPQCRMNMVHRACGHDITINEMEGGLGFNIHRDLPAALGASQQIPSRCNACHTNRNNNNNNNREPGRHNSRRRAQRDDATYFPFLRRPQRTRDTHVPGNHSSHHQAQEDDAASILFHRNPEQYTIHPFHLLMLERRPREIPPLRQPRIPDPYPRMHGDGQRPFFIHPYANHRPAI
ncbi:hypothetical protein CHU98_g9559 [Xylaria longipes]|nr:hypothetical protein CHU98_g9559 [Xylaria longipes]